MDTVDSKARIDAVVAEEAADGAACGWRPCTGCYESDDGHPVGHYPYSRTFGCLVGAGCSECGGLGVVWEHYSKADLVALAADLRVQPVEGQHTILLPDGGKVVLDGDRVEVHLAGPIVVRRKHWVRYFLPADEVQRTLLGADIARPISDALVHAFSTVPMKVYPESSNA